MPVLLLLLCFACEEEPPPTTVRIPDSSFGLVYTHILEPSCGLSGCHDGTSIHPKLIGDNVYFNAVTPHVHNAEARNAGLHLIKAFDPDSSFLYQKIIADSSAFPFGDPMPQVGDPIPANKIEFLRQWIAAGAPFMGHVADRNLLE